jgi:hypothetical protein
MAINVELREADGDPIQDGGSVEWRELPAFDDQRFPYLRLVDPYGDTVFSAYQCEHAVLAEVERFALERPSPNVDRLVGLVRRCSADVHTYVWFIGD